MTNYLMKELKEKQEILNSKDEKEKKTACCH
jgi:hypothetical protein